MIRESGYYWVKLNKDDSWCVGRFDRSVYGDSWYIDGRSLPDEPFKIGERRMLTPDELEAGDIPEIARIMIAALDDRLALGQISKCEFVRRHNAIIVAFNGD